MKTHKNEMNYRNPRNPYIGEENILSTFGLQHICQLYNGSSFSFSSQSGYPQNTDGIKGKKLKRLNKEVLQEEQERALQAKGRNGSQNAEETAAGALREGWCGNRSL